MRTKAITATALAGGVMLAMAPTAASALSTADTEYWSYTDNSASDDDNGGKDAIGALYPKGSEPGDYHYRAEFAAYGEVLTLQDLASDGYHAKAYVNVYDEHGTHVDKDTFILPEDTGRETYNLGTPDGTGNIPEDHKVTIQVCIDGAGCSQKISGKA